MTAPALSITALSPVSTAAVFCRLGGTLWATVVVKATLDLVHGEPARVGSPLPLVNADVPNGTHGSLANARETAPHLPNAGVVLTGHACTPGGKAVPSMSVRLGISRDRPLIDKTLHVFGMRSSQNPAAITPFQKMPLVYERAFGGAGVWENPVGAGGPGSLVLPNLVDPSDARKVAGFGPIAAQWMPRRGMLGGVDPALLASLVWDVPAGFDWRFFQTAPKDQQVDRLRGDEWILLDGMSSTLARVQSRLPQIMAAARKQSAAGEQPLELRADMLVIDADALRASIVWRGRFVVESLAALSGLRVVVGLEQPGRPIAWPAFSAVSAAPVAKSTPLTAETQDINLSAILGAKTPFSPDRESALPAAPTGPKATPAQPFTGTAAVDLRDMLRTPVPFAQGDESAADGASANVSRSTPLSSSTLDAFTVPQALLPFDPSAKKEPSISESAPPKVKSTPLFTGTTDINLSEILKAATPYGVEKPVAQLVEPAPTVSPETQATAVEQRVVTEAPSVLGSVALGGVLPASVSAPPVKPEGMDAGPTEGRSTELLSSAVELPLPSASPSPPASVLVRSQVECDLTAGRSLDGCDLSGANLSGLDFFGEIACALRFARRQTAWGQPGGGQSDFGHS
ncbi:MAG: DUF2169 domain-containing protein [Polyangiaceae bacterium]|nr:DUF2169 domain-containing protein [Polyangiaceae bacterium]